MENFDKYYRSYKYMEKLLATDFTYNYLRQNMADADKGQDVQTGRIHEKIIDMDWVTAIEDTLPYIEKAIDEQRRFIVENNEIYRIDKAKIINKDSVKHLIQHTNYIDNIDETGKVTPNKVLTIEREDSFETYENRFLITLIERALDFVADKYRKMVNAPTDTFEKIEMERDLVLNQQRITFKCEYSNEVKDAEEADLSTQDYESLSDFDRVRRIREKLNSFLNTDMMKSLAKCIRVKPPINRTNLMTKNPNYKAGLDLFTYLNSYKKPGYEIVGRDFTGNIDIVTQEGMYMAWGYQHFLMSLVSNPQLMDYLEERYQAQNALTDSEEKLAQEEREQRINEMIEKVREEEMRIRLKEIRDREKIIREQKAEIEALKREIEKRDKTIESLKSSIKALEERVKELENELQKVKAELLKAKERIKELEAKVEELEARIVILETKIAELEAKVAELEEIKAQLEAKITELEGIIEEQKARIAELEDTVAQQKARIEELEGVVAELEKIKAELEANVAALEKENAEQKATIEAHESTIAQQKEAIAGLESSIAAAKSEIETLNGTLSERDNTIAEQSSTIEGLNANVASLETNLADEKQGRADDIAKLNKKYDDDIAELNKKHEKEKTSIEEAHNKKIEKINKEHKQALDKVQKQCDSDKNRIKKDADARVKAAQKEADKKAKAEIKKQVDKAQAEAKKAAKKANEAAAQYKKELKIDKKNEDMFRFDFALGALGVQSMMAGSIIESGVGELPRTEKLSCVYIVNDNKKITVYKGTHNRLEVVKNLRGESDFDKCKSVVADALKSADKSVAYLTYKTVDKLYMNGFADFIREEAQFDATQIFHNKSQRSGKSAIGIYFYRG
ncbi:MAG: hypothetical protein K6F88_04620 [Ruminococcus sp.]|nr:hypothetical protein [Ruminococcus sp.]